MGRFNAPEGIWTMAEGRWRMERKGAAGPVAMGRFNAPAYRTEWAGRPAGPSKAASSRRTP